MKKKIYILMMIFLPLFVGIGNLVLLIQHFAGNQITMNPFFAALFAVVGISVGVKNIWELIK